MKKIDTNMILRLLVLGAGVSQACIGIAFIFLDEILNVLGYTSYNFIFPEMTGILMFGWGVILLNASRDIENNVVVILMAVLIHFFFIIPDIQNIIQFPEFAFLFWDSLIIDPTWAAIVLILLIRNGYLTKTK